MDIREKLVEILVEPCCGLYPASELADYLIEQGVTVQEWIPVTERLPNYYFEHVLINVHGDKPFTTVHEAHLRKDGLWVAGLYRYDREDVTHWMPLPTPPKGE